MNFEFSDEVTGMRDEVNRFLKKQLPPGAVRQQLETGAELDRTLWEKLAGLGWLSVAIPEEFGGAGLGQEALCMIAEEMGRFLPSVPFSSSIYLAAQAILEFGSESQKHELLPKLADGSLIGCFALAEGMGDPTPEAVNASVSDGKLTGTKLPVFDAGIADIAIVAARSPEGSVGLYLVELGLPGSETTAVEALDLGRRSARLDFSGARAQALPKARHWNSVTHLLDIAAILFAFEQVGGASAALSMALTYAQERFAFGRPIAGLQAIKHKLADIYVATELARSNAYFGAWALASGAAELTSAAAAARLSATDAFYLAAKENIQVHGGMGFTWESDCHLFYRRAKQISGNLGSARYWRNRLIDAIAASNKHEAA